jgi:predicted membrane channel-forming protein YqfA (hemolysin III family)
MSTTCSVSPSDQISSTNRALLIASSALFFIPTAVSFFKQSIIVSLLYFFSALFSTLYHASNEQKWVQEDVIYATFAILISLALLAILTVHYPVWNWRILVPLAFGIAGLVVYVTEGQLDDITCDIATNNYSGQQHVVWHFLMAIAATVLVWTPVDLSEANDSYLEMYKKAVKNNTKVPITLKSFTK